MNIMLEKLKGLVLTLKNEGKTEMVIINAIKEQIQYAVLDFVYNTSAYSHLVMYGGTLLRIGYGLPRMSEDLDFQTEKRFDFEQFKNDIVVHFKQNYDVDVEVDIKKKSGKPTGTAYLKFPLLKALESGHPWEKLRIRFDVNYFPSALQFATETIPITKDLYTFSIKMYPLTTLMASKIDAVLRRPKRGIKDKMADCKPRDIYDLMWYMEKKIIPNLDYLRAKGIEVANVLDLFNQLSFRVPNLDDAMFQHDLISFFYDPMEYELWHGKGKWRQRFQMLRNSYQIHRIKPLKAIVIKIDFLTENRFISYIFSTEDPKEEVEFTYKVSRDWYRWTDVRIGDGYRRKEIESKVISQKLLKDLDYEYVGLFYTKIEDYLKRNDSIVTQAAIQTKLIRAMGDNLNVKTQLFLDRRLLEKSKFEDLI